MADIVGSRTLGSQWDDTVQFYPENIFLEYISDHDEWTSYTYAEFDAQVGRCANLLSELGVRGGELVALHMRNTPQYLIVWLALARLGAVSVPLNTHYRLRESSYVLEKCDIRCVITEQSSLDMYLQNRDMLRLETIVLSEGDTAPSGAVSLISGMAQQSTEPQKRHDRAPEDMAVILFTSGTTRDPKGAIYTHSNVVYGGLLHAAQMNMCEGDRFFTCMPCCHMDFQEMAVMPVICTGSTLIMAERYSARRFWRQVCQYKAHFTDTMSIMNRTMLLQPVQTWEREHCLKQIYFSMGLSDDEKERFETRFGVRLLNSYGMTETVSAVTCAPLTGDRHWPSVGRPALSYEIKIVDNDGNELPPDVPGEICVHGIPGRSIVPGYYRDPEATARLLDSDGWLHSGDRGWLDKDGWLYFLDRSGNFIKRSGENVSCLEVECVLTSHEKIADAAVIGVPDPIRDEAVKAFVQLVPDASMTEQEVIAYCTDRMARFKVPAFVEFVAAFPRTPTGKIQKRQLQ